MGWDENPEAAEIYSGLLSETGLGARDLFNLGIALYRAGDFLAAADAFEQLTRLQPDSRDAWFNYANTLFAAESWESLATVADRLTEVDPLGENSGLIAARAHLEIGDEQTRRRVWTEPNPLQSTWRDSSCDRPKRRRASRAVS